MAEAFWTRLPDRGVIAVRGAESGAFLQNLLTNDVDDIVPGQAGYGALLTPQGKVLFDFVIHRSDDGFLFDVPAEQAPGLAQRLAFYRLRTPVEIEDESEKREIVVGWGADAVPPPRAIASPDPRLGALGYRAIVGRGDQIAAGESLEPADYHRHRIAHGIAEAGADFTLGEVFPHDVNMDQFAGVDFAKGCYVGQEVVSRMEHRGSARRRIVQVTGSEPLTSGADIAAEDQTVGTIGSVAGRNGLALVRVDRVARARAGGTPLTAGSVTIEAFVPAWADFTLDEPEAEA